MRLKRLLLALLLLNGLLLAFAALGLVAASGAVPEVPSWPHGLIVRNASGRPIRVTPVCVRPDGSPRPARLYPDDREAWRALDRVGGLPVAPGATASFVYDRENADLAVLVVEDEQGRLLELPAPPVAPGQTVTVIVDPPDKLAPLSPRYTAAWKKAQRPWRPRWPLAWSLALFASFAALFAAYRRSTRAG